MIQAAADSSTLHYLQAVKAAGTVEASAVMKMMKATPINDFFAHDGRIREDGRMVHDMYLFEVKPSESRSLGTTTNSSRPSRPRSLPAAVAIDLSAGEEIAVVTNRAFCVKSARRMSAISNHRSPDASARERSLRGPTRAPKRDKFGSRRCVSMTRVRRLSSTPKKRGLHCEVVRPLHLLSAGGRLHARQKCAPVASHCA